MFNLLNINSVRPIVREVLHYKKSGSALDLGCGAGRHALFLAKKGFRVTALDNRSESLAALKELARLQKLPITIKRVDAVTYASKRKFDIILSTMVLHFLPKLIHKNTIIKMQKNTKKRGLNVLSSYTDKNKNGTRPHLVHAGALKRAYEKTGWTILKHREGLGKPQKNAAGKIIRYWTEELIAQKP